MRLTIKGGYEGNGAEAARRASAPPPSGARPLNGTGAALLATAFRAVDDAAAAVREVALQVLSGVVPYVPRIRVRETSEAIIVSGRLWQVAEDTVEVTFVGRTLKISGAKIRQRERNRRTYRSVEKVYRTFERTIPIDCDIERDKVLATLGNELLTIHVPKKMKSTAPARSAAVTAERAGAA